MKRRSARSLSPNGLVVMALSSLLTRRRLGRQESSAKCTTKPSVLAVVEVILPSIEVDSRSVSPPEDAMMGVVTAEDLVGSMLCKSVRNGCAGDPNAL
ncbi:hypothetical protein KCU74_g34, partial [Aureobasidium melanogenum]